MISQGYKIVGITSSGCFTHSVWITRTAAELVMAEISETGESIEYIIIKYNKGVK